VAKIIFFSLFQVEIGSIMVNRIKLIDKHHGFLQMLQKFTAGSPPATAAAHGRISLSTHKEDSRIAILHIENVKRKGSIDAPMMLQLAAAVDSMEFMGAEAPLGLICVSSGDFYCSGLDLNLAKHCINTSAHGALMCAFMTDALDRVFNAPVVSVTVLGGG